VRVSVLETGLCRNWWHGVVQWGSWNTVGVLTTSEGKQCSVGVSSTYEGERGSPGAVGGFVNR
jgi:hypothetical protein